MINWCRIMDNAIQCANEHNPDNTLYPYNGITIHYADSYSDDYVIIRIKTSILKEDKDNV